MRQSASLSLSSLLLVVSPSHDPDHWPHSANDDGHRLEVNERERGCMEYVGVLHLVASITVVQESYPMLLQGKRRFAR